MLPAVSPPPRSWTEEPAHLVVHVGRQDADAAVDVADGRTDGMAFFYMKTSPTASAGNPPVLTNKVPDGQPIHDHE